ncbi:MAG: alpha/beta hydrolase [Gammaproteobacteria bacterium]|nr:alpha/beta hydrolase [Gammaproteobacteria bacterium]
MKNFPNTESTFILPGPAGDLEILTTPEKENITPRNAVGIICHPHPLFSGTMHNKVVTTLARVFSDLGLASVRFNFRGVGKSTGSYAEGIGETNDLYAVIDWVKKVRPNAEIWLAGFSFGSYVAARAASEIQVSQLISIAPPVARFDFLNLANITCPWVIVQGETDDVVIPAEVYAFVETLNPLPTLIKIPEAGHFFHKKLLVLREELENYFSF